MTDDHMYPNNFSCTYESKLAEESVDDVGEFIDTFDEFIIACVQSYPHLYNKNDKNYKDHVMKGKSWEEIAKSCNISIDEAQQRWKRLKDRYAKERRLNENATRSGSSIQNNKQWHLFESMKFMEKHIQRRRTFSNVPSQFRTKSQNNTSEELHFSQQSEGKNTSAIELSKNIVQSKQELTKVQSILPESYRMESGTQSGTQRRFPEKQLERSEFGFSKLQNCESSTSKTFKSCTEVHQSSMSPAHASTFDSSADSARSISSIPTYANIRKFGNSAVCSDRSSDISDCNETVSPNAVDTHSIDQDVGVAKLSTAVTQSLSIPTKCFSGGMQRKAKNKPDTLETSFVNATNALTEYIREKKEEKENYLPADEHLAKFIVSRLSELAEEKRDEKRRKVIDILLSK